ncbi:FIVAR domain-containing protein [Bifidobacterium leontopitheci]|uniref:Arabinosidase n=1 Tax=Bifidobacterium leontopitheci TaxID=2650774 RepID=A0A6I1GH31_9BIFI|nr:FIVAR domain-containing protein [Bifidobacterium leontopitheci]KAB7788986.1 arabinosidase [Bifidobacterium leontopitheci]
MGRQATSRMIGGLCALVIGLGGFGTGVSIAVAQPTAAASATASTAASATKDGKDGDAILASLKGKAKDPVKTYGTPAVGTTDTLKNDKNAVDLAKLGVKTLGSDITLRDFGKVTSTTQSNTQSNNDDQRIFAWTPTEKDTTTAKLTLYPQQVTHQQLLTRRGIAIQGTGFLPGEAISFQVAGPGDPLYSMTSSFAAYADNQGRFIHTVSYLDATYARQGDYTIKLVGYKSGRVATEKYTITDAPKAIEQGATKVEFATPTITQQNLWHGGTGLKYTISNLQPKEKVTEYLVTSMGDTQTIGNETADDNGTISASLIAQTRFTLTGQYQFIVIGEKSGATVGDYTVVETPDDFKDAVNTPADTSKVKFTINPKRVSQLAVPRGVQLSVTGLQPKENVEVFFVDPVTGWTFADPLPYTNDKGEWGTMFGDTSLDMTIGTWTFKIVGAKSGYVEDTLEVYKDSAVIDPKIELTGELAKHADKNGVVQMTQTEMLAEGLITYKASGYVPLDGIMNYLTTPTGNQIQIYGRRVGEDGTFEEDGSAWKGIDRFADLAGYGNAISPGYYTLVVADGWDSSINASIKFHVTDDSPEAAYGDVKVAQTQISPEDYYKKGLSFTVSGFKPGSGGTLVVTGPSGNVNISRPIVLDDQGHMENKLVTSNPDAVARGTYTITWYTGDDDHAKKSATYTVTDEKIQPTITLSLPADSYTQDELHDKGLTVNGTGLDAFQWTDVRLILPDGTKLLAATLQADRDGNIADTWKWDTDAAPAGTWTLRADTSDFHYGETKFAVTGTKTAGVDTTALQQLVKQAGSLRESDYTADSWATLATALNAAKDVLDNAASTSQAKVNTAWGNLNDAIEALAAKSGNSGNHNGGNHNGGGSNGGGSNGGSNGGGNAGGAGAGNGSASGNGPGIAGNGQQLGKTGASVSLMTVGILLALAGAAMLAKTARAASSKRAPRMIGRMADEKGHFDE